MFCFWCGDRLVEVDGQLTCKASGMGLSKKLSSELRTRIAKLSAVGRSEVVAPSTWYCPACGHRIPETTCANCGFALDNGLIYQFVELHPHCGA